MGGLRLWELSDMLRQAVEAAEEKVNPETGEVPEDWAEFLDTIQMERDQKCLNIAALYRELEAEAEAIREEAKRLIKRANTASNKAERLKAYLQTAVQPGEKLKNEWVSISWRKSTTCIIENPNIVPDTFCRTIREVSKSAVKDALSKGESVAGARLEEHQNIQIR